MIEVIRWFCAFKQVQYDIYKFEVVGVLSPKSKHRSLIGETNLSPLCSVQRCGRPTDQRMHNVLLKQIINKIFLIKNNCGFISKCFPMGSFIIFVSLIERWLLILLRI